jgi:aspartate/methionine/tyrosine aminotransferase
MQNFFARRTSWDLTTNRYTEALDVHRRAGGELLDLTASNPTTIGLQYSEEDLLRALANPEALRYDPQPKGLLAAREAIASYYQERSRRIPPDNLPRNSQLSPDDLILTTSTSEAYSFVFRLLCDPGDALLLPTPSYPLFDFLAGIQDVRLIPYELIYDHGWQMDFTSLRSAMERAKSAGTRCRAVLVVHPNNPTGSYVKPPEAEELSRFCTENNLAIIADEVFLDYSLSDAKPLTFSTNHEVLTFTLSGLSKISALPQMKVAWIAVSGPCTPARAKSARAGDPAAPTLKQDALNRLEVIADTYLSMNAPVQLAVPAMLDERHRIQPQLVMRVKANLHELDSQLASQKLCDRLEVEGGWYAVLRVPAVTSDEELAIRLLQHENVLVQPGHFYDFPADGYLVISLITQPEIFRAGVAGALNYFAIIAR